MAEFLGHSNNFDTLSQVLTYNRLYIEFRGRPRVNIRLFLQSGKGGRIVFIPIRK